jgi:Sec-independent protein secretion pathway component TatC
MAKLPGAVRGAGIVGGHFVRTQLVDHLRELRNRVVKMALALAAGMVVGLVFFNPVWHVIERPVVPRGGARGDRVPDAAG